jgi:alkylated DNA repair dioxygenase AlkB
VKIDIIYKICNDYLLLSNAIKESFSYSSASEKYRIMEQNDATILEVDEEGYAIIKCIELPPKLVDIRANDVDGNPQHAVVRYDKTFFTPEEAAEFYKELRAYDRDGLNDGGNMYGVKWQSGRKTIQVSDPGVPVYKYTGSSAKKTEPFTNYPAIERIRDILLDRTGYMFNFCLYNSYPLDSKLGWHSDNEKNMLARYRYFKNVVAPSPIGSLSFGFKRRFRVRTIGDTPGLGARSSVLDEFLESGSFLIMEEGCQQLTEHCIWTLTEKQMEAIKAEIGPGWEEETIRINLTYRMMVPISK